MFSLDFHFRARVTKQMKQHRLLIDKPIKPIALDIEEAFWESSLVMRGLFAFAALSTVGFMTLTGIGGFGGFE